LSDGFLRDAARIKGGRRQIAQNDRGAAPEGDEGESNSCRNDYFGCPQTTWYFGHALIWRLAGLKSGLAAIAVSNAQGVVDGRDEYLAIADFARASGRADRIQDCFQL